MLRVDSIGVKGNKSLLLNAAAERLLKHLGLAVG
jgi:hypothetical protein